MRTFANGEKYDGEWKDGDRHGKGIETDENGDVYYGWFEYNLRHGEGIITLKKTGKEYDIMYENNREVSCNPPPPRGCR